MYKFLTTLFLVTIVISSCGTITKSNTPEILHRVDIPDNWETYAWQYGVHYNPKHLANNFAKYNNQMSVYERVTDSTPTQVLEQYLKRSNKKFLIKELDTKEEQNTLGNTHVIDMEYKRFGKTFKSKTFIFKTNERTYTIAITFNKSIYDTFMPQAMQIVSSFRTE